MHQSISNLDTIVSRVENICGNEIALWAKQPAGPSGPPRGSEFLGLVSRPFTYPDCSPPLAWSSMDDLERLVYCALTPRHSLNYAHPGLNTKGPIVTCGHEIVSGRACLFHLLCGLANLRLDRHFRASFMKLETQTAFRTLPTVPVKNMSKSIQFTDLYGGNQFDCQDSLEALALGPYLSGSVVTINMGSFNIRWLIVARGNWSFSAPSDDPAVLIASAVDRMALYGPSHAETASYIAALFYDKWCNFFMYCETCCTWYDALNSLGPSSNPHWAAVLDSTSPYAYVTMNYEFVRRQ